MGMRRNQNSGKNMGNVRQENRSLVLRQLYFHGKMSRAVLAKDLSLTPASITMTVNAMIDEGVVTDTAQFEANGAMGRKRQYVDIVLSGRLAVGISMVTRTIRLVVTDLGLHVLYAIAWELGEDAASSYAQSIADRIAFALYALGKTKDDVAGIGVTIRGHVDTEHGVSVDSFGLLPASTRIQSDLERITHLPVTVDNHIRSLLVSDALHSRRWVDNSVFVKFGPGISSAIVMNGQLYTGSGHRSGEIGHMVMDPSGPLCRCGKHGCLETYASFRVLRELPGACTVEGVDGGPGVASRVCPGVHPFQTPADMLACLESGDAVVRRVLDRAVDSVLLAISNMTTLFDPSVVVLYGDWFASGMFRDMFMEHAATGCPELSGRLHVSSHNLELDECMACALAVHQYLQCGAIREGSGCS